MKRTRWFFLLTVAMLAIVALPGCSGATAASITPDATTVLTPIPVATRVINTATPTATVVAGAVATAPPLPTIAIPTPLPPATEARATPATAPAQAQPASTPVPMLTPLASAPETIESLRGKILFRSDRSGTSVQLYVMNPDGGDQHPCDCSDVFEALTKREVTSPDGQMFLFIKSVGGTLRQPTDQQIWSHNNRTNYEALVTGEAPGFPGVDYAPVWSPDSRHIAWVSETDANDEIYLHDIVNGDNERLSENDKAWDKHPSFSPDGSQIVFWSNRDSAVRKQIWIINLDGGGAHNISQNNVNDTDPIWVK